MDQTYIERMEEVLRLLSRPLDERAPVIALDERHMEVIRCFGRFSHRNLILNRPSTPAEAQFIASGVLPR